MRPLVWVADDSPTDLDHARRAIGDACETRLFPDGSALLEQLATQRPPDVIVLDWMMPGISGVDVVRFMRSREGGLPQVPVLLLTARGNPEQIVEGLDAGANDYLPKPYYDAELRARVSALVRTSELLTRAQRAEESVRALLANAPDGLVVVDAQGTITFANEEVGRIFSREPAAVVGTPIEALLPDLSFRSISIGAGAGLLPLPDVTVGERILSPTVRVLPTDTAASTTIALRDVTARRRAEAKRLDFYSILAHDLRSPLNAMLMRAQLLMQGRRGPLPAEVVAEVRRFQATIRSMVKMIKDFLDLAAMEGAGYKIDREEIDLVGLTSSMIEELRPLADASGLAVEWEAPDERFAVLGDRHRLAQVLSNLIGNAIKYTPSGGRITVTARLDGPAVELTVRDTGPGIAPELFPTLFDRFTRGDAVGPRPAGWGLGLMIVREIVEAHGGTVGVHSEPGRGSAFWVRLPHGASVPRAAAADRGDPDEVDAPPPYVSPPPPRS